MPRLVGLVKLCVERPVFRLGSISSGKPRPHNRKQGATQRRSAERLDPVDQHTRTRECVVGGDVLHREEVERRVADDVLLCDCHGRTRESDFAWWWWGGVDPHKGGSCGDVVAEGGERETVGTARARRTLIERHIDRHIGVGR